MKLTPDGLIDEADSGKSTFPPPELRAQIPARVADTVADDFMVVDAVTVLPLTVAESAVLLKVVVAAMAGEVLTRRAMPINAAVIATRKRRGRL